jgi:hypothetical protein
VAEPLDTAALLEVRVSPTGDCAEAEDLLALGVAGRTLLEDALESGCAKPTAAFYLDGRLVRDGVTLGTLNTEMSADWREWSVA